jgi:dTDP-glucose pyrophosphorylase
VVSVTSPVVALDATIRDAIASIERTQRIIVAVTDEDRILRGIVSDGDIRRAILSGCDLDSPVTKAMSTSPIVGRSDQSLDELNHIMVSRGVAAVPVVDQCNRFVRVVLLREIAASDITQNMASDYWAAVIMAGGEGRRLRPLTANLPKPMIQVGGVPVLERQVRDLVATGVDRIFVSTNYLGNVIEEHFGDGREFGASIQYLREKTKLGTAGALSLLSETPTGPVLVMNGDVLTTSDYGKLLAYHLEREGQATVATVTYKAEIPFGVVDVRDYQAFALTEKPMQVFQCNAGIYVLEPDCLSGIPCNTMYNMTDLISDMINAGAKVSVFPIHEHWADIGSPTDLENARKVFEMQR